MSIANRSLQQQQPKMIGSVFVFAAVAVVPLAVTALPAPAHPAPYDETPKPYGFEYGVHDSYSGASFDQHENSDGKVVSGSYTVQLPDGRKQVRKLPIIS